VLLLQLKIAQNKIRPIGENSPNLVTLIESPVFLLGMLHAHFRNSCYVLRCLYLGPLSATTGCTHINQRSRRGMYLIQGVTFLGSRGKSVYNIDQL
jgi:hypothetical protein